MERGALWRLLNEEREKPFSLRGVQMKLRLLPAAELLALYAAPTAGEDEFSRAMEANAALAAKVLCAEDGPVFCDGVAALHALTAEEIHAVVDAYRRWSGEVDPGFGCTEAEADALKKA